MQNIKYNKLTGEFERAPCKYKPNMECITKGYKGPGGYLYLKISGVRYSAHNLAIELSGITLGEFEEIDHIDGNRENNCLSNLRVVSRKENMKNKRKYSNNKSGVVGVVWDKKELKWKSRINKDGKRIHLGTFGNLEDAIREREKAEKEYGYHKNHGKFCGYSTTCGY